MVRNELAVYGHGAGTARRPVGSGCRECARGCGGDDRERGQCASHGEGSAVHSE